MVARPYLTHLQNLRHDFRQYWLNWRTQFRAETKLRGAFALRVLGIMFNNVGLTVAWLFLFQQFGTINGWSGVDLVGVQGVNMLVFGVVMLLNSGVTELPRHVDTGSFDTFLTKPSGILPQVASSFVEIAALGDVILGIGLITWYAVYIQASLAMIGMFALAMLIGWVLMWCFTFMPFLLSFYIFDSQSVARNIQFFFFDIGIYPSGVISGGLRWILLTVFPGLFIGAIPLNVLRGQHWEYLLLGLAVAIAWLLVSLWLFRRALRRYESANLIGAR